MANIRMGKSAHPTEHVLYSGSDRESKGAIFRPLFDVFLFIALLASLAIYFNQDALLGQEPAPQLADTVDITIDDLLLNKTGLIDDNVDRLLSEVNAGSSRESILDQSVKEFINQSYLTMVDAESYQAKKVHIYEVVDQQQKREKINRILIEANELFEQDKLTTPEFENAFSKYQYVLSLDPDNPKALEGINNIVNRYVFFMDKVIEKNEFYKVSILIDSAYNVGEGYVDIEPIIEKYKAYLSEDDLLSYQALFQSNEVEDVTALSDERVVSDKLIKADYQITELAMGLIEDGESDTALKVLSEFVELYPGKSHAYDLLLQHYLNNGDAKSAEHIIYQNVQYESVYLAEKTARVFIASGDYRNALTLLESNKPEFTGNPDYYYLLAGLNIKLGHYEEAHSIYEKLVMSNRYNAYYWFGLAVTLDAKGEESAVRGYNVAKKIAIKGSLIDRYYQYRFVG